MDVLNFLQRNWALVHDHPWVFASVISLAFGAGWGCAWLLLKERIEILKERAAGASTSKSQPVGGEPGHPKREDEPVSRGEMKLLTFLSDRGTAQITALEGATALPRGQLEFFVTRLEQRGAITCTNDFLGSRNLVHITHAGRELLYGRAEPGEPR